MRRLFALLLALGFMSAMIGQEAAFAQMAPTSEARETATPATQMSAECAEMMGLAKQKPKSDEPCHGMTPECIAKMGCAVPVALLPPLAPDAIPQFRTALPGLVPAAPLIGRNFGPEPEPPAPLG